MSNNKKPDGAQSASDGEEDKSRRRFLEDTPLSEILLCLRLLVFFVTTAGFLAFESIVDAIYEEQYERDVAWISRQSRNMYPTEDDDDDDDDDEDDEDYEDEDDEQLEALEYQMDAAEAGKAENELRMEVDVRSTWLFDLVTCTCE